jgi:hypothetical protein
MIWTFLSGFTITKTLKKSIILESSKLANGVFTVDLAYFTKDEYIRELTNSYTKNDKFKFVIKYKLYPE